MELGYLDRFLTFEVPQHLARALVERGLSPDIVEVSGLSFDRYVSECLKGDSRQKMQQRLPDDLPRFEISGMIIPTRDGIRIRSMLYDRHGRGPFTISDYLAESSFDEEGLPLEITNRLADSLILFLVQDQLEELGFEPGRVNGTRHPETTSALARFQAEHALVSEGKITAEALAALVLR